MTTPIDIPRLPNERNERYEARVLYLTAGADRNLRETAQKCSKSISLIARWSDEDGWVALARAYDEAMAQRAAQAHAERYLADLEEHRARYGGTGKALHGVAMRLLTRLSADADAAESLSTIARALTIAADLEAHALRIADLLPRLDADVPD